MIKACKPAVGLFPCGCLAAVVVRVCGVVVEVVGEVHPTCAGALGIFAFFLARLLGGRVLVTIWLPQLCTSTIFSIGCLGLDDDEGCSKV